MKASITILILFLTLLCNLSYAQADSLFGKEVTVSLHKTKKTVIGEYRSYKNNRVTVLFDNSLHDYFYPEVKLLQFEGFNLRFTEKGEFILEQIEMVQKPKIFSNVYDDITPIEEMDHPYVSSEENTKTLYPLKNKALILQHKTRPTSNTLNLNKKVKVILNNGVKLKSRHVEILNDSTLLFVKKNYQHPINLDEIYMIKGYRYQSDAMNIAGDIMVIGGVVTAPWLLGIPIIIISKYVRGYRSATTYRWKLEIK